MILNRALTFILWLALAFACFLPASALTLAAPENRIWEIFSTGYDAPIAEATDLGNRTETSTSDYDTASIRGAKVLSPLQEHLTPVELKKLDYAKNHL